MYPPRSSRLYGPVSGSLQRVIDALEALDCRPKGGDERGYVALCPAHNDSLPSLSIRHRDDKTLVFCHAGCSTEAVLDAMGLAWTALFDDEAR